MSASAAAMTSPAVVYNGPAFWERLWRMSGIGFLVFVLVAYGVSGSPPPAGAQADALVAFYSGGRTRVLIAAVVSGMALLNLLWFVAALRATLADAGRDGWGAAATAAGAAFGAIFLLFLAVVTALAHSIAGWGNPGLATALNEFAWTCFVLSAFPRAMLIMASAFGLWRAGLISNSLFAVGVAAIVLTLLGGTTWLSGGGLWALDGVYSRIVSPAIGLAWLLVVSWILLSRSPATRAAW